MTFKLKKQELALLLAVLFLVAVASFAPALAQPLHPHVYADARGWGFVPCAGDVLSNLPFAVWGAAGLGLLAMGARPRGADHADTDAAQTGLAALFFAGLLATAFASAFYHWQPDDNGLVVDRLGMTVAFAGLIGLAAAGRVSARAGVMLGLAVVAFGLVSIALWRATGNLLPWVVLQLGGVVLVLTMAWLRPLPGALAVRWAAVILIYALAKLFEVADAAVYAATSEFVSGHSLKHLVASFAAWPVLAGLVSHRKSRGELADVRRIGGSNGRSHCNKPAA